MSLKRFMLKDLNGFFRTSIVSISLLFVYSLICSLILPKGVNAVFTAFLWKILLGILAMFAVHFSIWLFMQRKMSFSYKKNSESFQWEEFVLLLIPMTPVMQYILSNQNSLTIPSSIFIFIFFGLIAALTGIAVPVLLSRVASKNILITAAISFLYLLMTMAALSVANEWVGKGFIPIQLGVLAGLILIVSLRKVIPGKIFLIAVIVFFAVNTITGALFRESSEGMPAQIKNLPVVSTMEGMKIKKHNDILLIVFEGYANSETMKYYGYDNSGQSAFLEANGFHVYNGTYSTGAPTEQSLSKTFNVDRDIKEHKKFLAGGGAVHFLLSQQGYKTYGVFDDNWNLRGLPIDQIKYDFCFPQSSGVMDAKVLINAILTGEFSDTVSFEGVDFNSYLKTKHKVIGKENTFPVFMYSHSSNPGHGPSGKGMSLDQRDARIKYYLDGLERANVEMKEDVNEIVKKNPDAIVIIAGDHGPFLTKTGYGLSKGRGDFKAADIDRYDIQDRFGAFLAIRWPQKQYALKHDIKIIQDMFPAVFSYLYDDDTLFNKTRIERMTKENFRTLGVYVKDGIVYGGKDNGQKLFLMER